MRAAFRQAIPDAGVSVQRRRHYADGKSATSLLVNGVSAASNAAC